MRTTLTLILALAAFALATATAAAATTILRPNATTMIQSPWTVSPFGTTADAVLDDAVVQPSAPSTAADLVTVSGRAAGPYVMLSFPAPNLPAGTAPTAVTAWIYTSVGAGQTL